MPFTQQARRQQVTIGGGFVDNEYPARLPAPDRFASQIYRCDDAEHVADHADRLRRFQARFNAGLAGTINKRIDLGAKLLSDRQNLFQFVKQSLVAAILQVFDQYGGEALNRIEWRTQVMPQPLTEGFDCLLLAGIVSGVSMTLLTRAPSRHWPLHAGEVYDRLVEMRPPGLDDEHVEKSGHRNGWRGQFLAQERGERTLKPLRPSHDR